MFTFNTVCTYLVYLRSSSALTAPARLLEFKVKLTVMFGTVRVGALRLGCTDGENSPVLRKFDLF